MTILYPFNRPPIEMMLEASIQPGDLDGFHIAVFGVWGLGNNFGATVNQVSRIGSYDRRGVLQFYLKLVGEHNTADVKPV